jgi:cellulose synthase/poly-beta-1,6-N-acetylglucosamine synthase-like glycosyltransferase
VWNARQHPYIKGLQGANTVITRQALDQIKGLDFPARTGTDYLLAQRLIKAGIEIRYISTSIVPTEFPNTIGAYLRQRSRWLRNLLIHGLHQKSKEDVLVTVKTMAIGTLMLMMPLTIFILGSTALMVWFLFAAHAVICKIRYVLFMARLHQRKISVRMMASLAPLAFIDFVAWTMPILDLTSTRRREKW